MIKNFKKTILNVKTKFVGMMVILFLTIPTVAKAEGQPKIISGTIELVNTASTWVLVLAPIVGGLFGGYHAIRKSTCEDDMEIKKHEKMIKNSVIGVILALSVSGIISFVSGYYS